MQAFAIRLSFKLRCFKNTFSGDFFPSKISIGKVVPIIYDSTLLVDISVELIPKTWDIVVKLYTFFLN